MMLVPGFYENLQSVDQMMQHGCFLLFGDDKVGIFKDRSLERHVVMQMAETYAFLVIEDMLPFSLKAITEEDS